MLFRPRALHVDEVSLPVLSFSDHGEFVVFQEVAEPIHLQTVIQRDLQRSALGNMAGGERLQQRSRNRLSDFRAFEHG